MNRCFELHYGSPSPSEQRKPEIFTVTQTHLSPGFPEARRPAVGCVTSWHLKLPPRGVPLRSPGGETDHVAARCSRNGKHPRVCPTQRSPGLKRLQERRSSLLVLTLLELGVGSRGGGKQPLPRLGAQLELLFPDGDCQPLSTSDTR